MGQKIRQLKTIKNVDNCYCVLTIAIVKTHSVSGTENCDVINMSPDPRLLHYSFYGSHGCVSRVAPQITQRVDLRGNRSVPVKPCARWACTRGTGYVCSSRPPPRGPRERLGTLASLSHSYTLTSNRRNIHRATGKCDVIISTDTQLQYTTGLKVLIQK